jgi:hypothetical protein
MVAVVPLLVVLVTSCLPGGTTSASPDSERVLTGSINGASYVIRMPASWNGALLLYSHGGGALTSNPRPETSTDPVTAEYLMHQGYALAGSSFRSSGWFVEDALADDLALISEFRRLVARPKRTIAWGVSLGSMVTIGLSEQPQSQIDGALALCGVIADAVPFWNQNLDAAYAFKVLFAKDDPQVQVVGSTPSIAAGEDTMSLLRAAARSPAGRARTALVAALREIPVQGFNGAPGPDGTRLPVPSGLNVEDLRAQSLADLVGAALADYFVNHPALEVRAGGNPSSNTGVDYGKLVAASPDYGLIQNLYAVAGLSLGDDIARLQQAPRIGSDPSALAYLGRFLTFTGKPSVPVITMHTVSDESTPVQLEDEYRAKVRSAGRSDFLRQLFVNRGAHCNFATAELAVAIRVLVTRITTGKWGAADDPSALNLLTSQFKARYWAPIRAQLVGGPTPRSYPSFVAFQSIGLLRNAAGQL